MYYRCRDKQFFFENRRILQIYFHGIIETQRVCNHQILDFLLDFLIGEPANSVHTMSRKSRNSHIFGAKIPKFSKLFIEVELMSFEVYLLFCPHSPFLLQSELS